jgi:hypothetical protein
MYDEVSDELCDRDISRLRNADSIDGRVDAGLLLSALREKYLKDIDGLIEREIEKK